jgi:hypothetical protein
MMLVGQDSHGNGRDSFALLQSNDIFLDRRPVWRVNVEHLLALLAVSLVPQLVVWVTYDIEIQISNSHAFHVPFKYRYCDMQAH